MIDREYIDKNLHPLFNAALVEEAIIYFLENKLSESFILSGSEALLLLKFSDIINEDPLESAAQFASPFDFKITASLHWSQLLTFFNTLNIGILPAFNNNNEFVGLITRNALISRIPDFTTLEEPGAIILLECDSIFYAASEVIRIAEMHNTRVVALFTHYDNATKTIKITLKVTLQEIRDITGAYERFGYQVTGVFMNKDLDNDVYADRYESLLRIFDLK